MDTAYHISYVDDPEQSAWGIVGRGISAYNEAQAGPSGHQLLCFALYDAQETIVGGLVGSTSRNWLHVELLWLAEELRGQGHGQRLLKLAEDEARKRGATNAYLDTFSFQAPGFYQRLGYHIFGELADFPPGHKRYFLTKEL